VPYRDRITGTWWHGDPEASEQNYSSTLTAPEKKVVLLILRHGTILQKIIPELNFVAVNGELVASRRGSRTEAR